MVFQTSADILNLSIAFAVVLVAVFIAWMLYYVIAMLRDARDMVKDVREKMETIDSAIQAIRHKVESGISGFTVVAAGLKQVLSYVMDKRVERADRSSHDEDECDEEPVAVKNRKRKM